MQIPVAEDLFLNRSSQSSGSGSTVASPSTPSSTSSSGDLIELESQRECVLNMLLKLIVYPDAMETVIAVVGAVQAEGGDERWRKISRTLADVVIPLLASQKIRIKDKRSLDLVRALFATLAPGSLRPVDPLLEALLTSSVDLSNLEDVERWLGFVVVALPILTNQVIKVHFFVMLEAKVFA